MCDSLTLDVASDDVRNESKISRGLKTKSEIQKTDDDEFDIVAAVAITKHKIEKMYDSELN